MSKCAIFFLHGYGSDAQAMRDFVASHFGKYLPDSCETVFMDGFIEAPSGGRAWFDLEWYHPAINLDDMPSSILIKLGNDLDQALSKASNKIIQKAEEIQVPLNRVCLFGFSQGAMMSLALCSRIHFAGVISYAGLYLNVKENDLYSTKNVMLVHGDKDNVVLFEALARTKGELKKRGVNPTICEDSGSGHVISGRTFKPMGEFVKRVL